jgi:tryptophan-rich sensory protein
MAYTWRAPYWFFSMVWAQVVLAICMAVGGHYAQTLHPDTFKVRYPGQP